MSTNRERRHGGETLRLNGYDYSSDGVYFVTMVARDRELVFADAPCRGAVEQTWLELGERYPYVRLDEFVVMPNHLHALVAIEASRRGLSRKAPTGTMRPVKTLGSLIGAFKTLSTQAVNRIRGTQSLPLWQSDFYDHIVRNDGDLNRIREYIIANPRLWAEDPENPDSTLAEGIKAVGPFSNGP